MDIGNMRECISLHIGQAGAQIGNAMWELYNLEHGVSPQGLIDSDSATSCEDCSSFYNSTQDNKLTPRALFIDTEPTVIDEIRSGYCKGLYNPTQLITGKEDASNNFARGRFTTGKSLMPQIEDQIRRQAEKTTQLQGFFLYHSYGGGTGAGLTSLVMDKLMDIYGKIAKVSVSVYPSPQMSTAVVEPYNTVLHAHTTINTTDASILVDNEALYRICLHKLDVECPTYTNVNRLIAQCMGVVTTSMRFGGATNIDLQEMLTNVIPYPRLHFPMLNFSPTVSPSKVYHRNITVQELTYNCFDPSNQLIRCDPRNGKYISCVLFYRGDVMPQQANAAIINIKEKKISFVDWCPTGFKVGFQPNPPVFVPGGDFGHVNRSLAMISNTSAILETWIRADFKYDLMFSKRTFVHWYISEGMEEGEFIECRENMASLERDYLDAAVCSSELDKDSDTLA